MGDVSLRDFAPIRWKWRIQRLAQRNDASGALLFIVVFWRILPAIPPARIGGGTDGMTLVQGSGERNSRT